MEETIKRAALNHGVGVEEKEIHQSLVDSGESAENAWLAVVAGRLLAKDRENSPWVSK